MDGSSIVATLRHSPINVFCKIAGKTACRYLKKTACLVSANDGTSYFWRVTERPPETWTVVCGNGELDFDDIPLTTLELLAAVASQQLDYDHAPSGRLSRRLELGGRLRWPRHSARSRERAVNDVLGGGSRRFAQVIQPVTEQPMLRRHARP